MQLTTNNVDILCQITVNICSGEIDLMNRWGSEVNMTEFADFIHDISIKI